MKTTNVPPKIKAVQSIIEKHIDQFHIQRYGETIAQRFEHRAEKQHLIDALGTIPPAAMAKSKSSIEKSERLLLANAGKVHRSGLIPRDAQQGDPSLIIRTPPQPQPNFSPAGPKEYLNFFEGFPNNMSAPLVTTAEYGGLGWWDAPPYMVPAVVNNHGGNHHHELFLWWTLTIPRDGLWWFTGFPSVFIDYSYILTEGPGISVDSSLFMQAWADLSLDHNSQFKDCQPIVDDYARVSTATGEACRRIPFGGWGYQYFRALKSQYISMSISLHIWDYARNGISITHLHKFWVMANNFRDFYLIQVA